MTAVAVEGLLKKYGDHEAVRGVDFAVEEGEIFALLGPNGAGKTTTMEILEGFRHRDGGDVRVLGRDPGDKADGRWLRGQIGLVLQDIAVEPYLSVRETIARNAGYYPAPRDIDEVIGLVGLAEKRDAKVKDLSGGQKRRLDLALGVIGDPKLLFLDEPTTGFDPGARRGAWEVVRSLRDAGTTILLTTWTRRRPWPTPSPSSPPGGSSPRAHPTPSADATAPSPGSGSPCRPAPPSTTCRSRSATPRTDSSPPRPRSPPPPCTGSPPGPWTGARRWSG